jgi:hypothetical protein
VKKYWDNPPDAEINTEKNILRYFKGAAKLQVQMPKWTNKDGEEMPGKCVTINLDALRESEGGVDFIQKIIADIA